MKKLLFALLCVTNLFAQDQNIPSQEKPDLIKQAIEKNLDFELVKKAIELKEPTADEIKSYLEISERTLENYNVSDLRIPPVLKPLINNNKEKWRILNIYYLGFFLGSMVTSFCGIGFCLVDATEHNLNPQVILPIAVMMGTITLGLLLQYFSTNYSEKKFNNALKLNDYLLNYKQEQL